MESKDSFNRILTLLRKEKGLTQKEAAASLGISQALLSHYEKGIRECGLSFVVRVADFYGVSCDYLLGRSPDRSGLTLSVDEIPNEEDRKDDNKLKGSLLPILSKKLLINSISILYDFLLKNPDKNLVTEVTHFLNSAVYKMFRMVYSSNSKNQEKMFSIPANTYEGYVTGSMYRSEADIRDILSSQPSDGTVLSKDAFATSTEQLSIDYPQQASSLFNLIQEVESKAK
ncbi:MAG: helix-turn-helix domain-containing protein [Oscillospiraceae bacterium]|nr:helix-turn-helix domain-containing protein [Oscillospiraceae bacterium]